MDMILVAEVGDGDAVDQMTPEDGDFLNGRIVLAGAFASEKLLPSSTITRSWRFSISG
jgi:hypothetical protein